MTLDDEDVSRILRIIDEMPFDEVELEWKGLRLRVSKRGELSPALPPATAGAIPANAGTPSPAPVMATTAPVPAAPATPPPPPPAGERFDANALGPGLTVVKAPVMGTFYQSPEPGKPPFVNVGQAVDDETTVCLLEVMKVYTAVKSDVAGTIERILVADAQFVEFGQPLFVVRT